MNAASTGGGSLVRGLGGLVLAGAIVLVGLARSVAQVRYEETFGTPPAERGWRAWGEGGLFVWDATAQGLAVTWDSSRSNSFFARPLGTVLTRTDDFELSFTLVLHDVATGVSLTRPSTFQLAVGLLRLSDGLRTNFWRGSGLNAVTGPRNALEFDYFPDSESGFGETISMALVSSNNQFADFEDMMNFPVGLVPGVRHEVRMVHTAADQVLRTMLRAAGQPLGALKELAYAGTAFTDFRLDHVAVMSFSDEGQDPRYGGSILAHGTVDDVVVVVPGPPVDGMWVLAERARRGVVFRSRPHWTYLLERSVDLGEWTPVDAPAVEGTGLEVRLEDPSPPAGAAFYRVQAQR